MLYDSSNKILKNGSLTSKVYFLLLKSPLTISEISKLIYDGKVQLAHINKILDQLEKEDYIESTKQLDSGCLMLNLKDSYSVPDDSLIKKTW